MARSEVVFPALFCSLIAVARPAAGGESFVFALDGFQAVPRVATLSSGSCTGVLDGDRFTVNCHHDLLFPVAAHVHRGAPGRDGPLLFDLGDGGSPVTATLELDPQQRGDLLNDRLYLEIHASRLPRGAIRGQIRTEAPLDRVRRRVELGGQQVVPPVSGAASGHCVLTQPGTGSAASFLEVVCVHDVANPTAAHIHQALPGATGSVILDLGDPASPIVVELFPDEDQRGVFGSPDFYLDVHSAEHPDGEIRGQLGACPASRHTLCLGGGRFAVTAGWRTATAGDNAVAVPESEDSGLFWFFAPDNRELVVKVLDGCRVNGHFWVFAAGATNIEVTLEVFDLASRQSRTYQNPLGRPAPPVLDTAAFAACP